MDPAHAGKTGQRLPIAILLGGFDPFARPAVVGQVATRADHPAGRHSGREWRELSVDRRDRGLLHQRESVFGLARGDLQGPKVRKRIRLEIGVVGARADVDGLLRERECRFDVPRRTRCLAPDEGEISEGVAVPFRPEDPLRPACPRRCDRMLAGKSVTSGDVQRDDGRPNRLALGFIGLERTLVDVEFDIGPGHEEGCQPEGLEDRRRKAAFGISLREEIEGVRPAVLLDRVPSCMEHVGDRGES